MLKRGSEWKLRVLLVEDCNSGWFPTTMFKVGVCNLARTFVIPLLSTWDLPNRNILYIRTAKTWIHGVENDSFTLDWWVEVAVEPMSDLVLFSSASDADGGGASEMDIWIFFMMFWLNQSLSMAWRTSWGLLWSAIRLCLERARARERKQKREREKLRILLQNSVHGEWRRNNNKIKRVNEWVLGVWSIHYHRPHLLNPI